MTRQDLIHKWAVYALALLPVWLLDSCILPRFPLFGITPMLLPLALTAVAVLEGSVAGAGFGMESKIACAIVSTSASWDSLSVDLIVTVSSRIVQFLSFWNSARISPAAVGAQEPFSMRAMVRFWRL